MGILSSKILMPSDMVDITQGDASLHDQTTGAFTLIASSNTPASNTVPYCEVGDILPSGIWCVPYMEADGTRAGLAFFDADDQLITTVTSIVSGLSGFQVIYVRGDHDATFWVLVVDTDDTGTIYQFDETGTQLQALTGVVDPGRGDYPFSTSINGFAIKYDGSVVYVTTDSTFAPAKVFTYQVGTDAWDASPLISVASRRTDLLDGLILCHGGDTLAVSLRAGTGFGDLARYVRLYTLAGVQVGSEFSAGTTGDPNEMGVDPSDDASLWLKTLGAGSTTYTVYQLNATDLSATLVTWGGNTLEGGGTVPVSCPLLVFPPATDEGIEPPAVRGPSEECCPCEENPQAPAPGQSPTDSAAPLPSVTGAILPPTFLSVMAWVPSCTGGGDVPTAADATDAESWVS